MSPLTTSHSYIPATLVSNQIFKLSFNYNCLHLAAVGGSIRSKGPTEQCSETTHVSSTVTFPHWTGRKSHHLVRKVEKKIFIQLGREMIVSDQFFLRFKSSFEEKIQIVIAVTAGVKLLVIKVTRSGSLTLWRSGGTGCLFRAV